MTFLQLSPDQDAALSGIISTLFGGDPNDAAVAVLTGSAGVGKTTVMSKVIDAVRAQPTNPHIELCATTHRAGKVLEGVVGYSTRTAHSAFGIQPSIDRNGKETLKDMKICEIPNGSFVAIDEASMFGNTFFKLVAPIFKRKALKVLFIGDPYQLPPTHDTCSIFDGSLPTFKLTKVHRQAQDNPILAKAIEYRDFIAGLRPDEPTIETALTPTGEGIHVLPHSEFVSKFVARYMDYAAGTEIDAPLCTFTNESAINYNNMIRKAAYFLTADTVQPFYVGERLISNAIVKDQDRIILTNNEVVIVEDFVEHTHNGIPGYLVKVTGDFNRFTGTATKQVFCAKNSADVKRKLDELKTLAKTSNQRSLWVDFYALKNYIADLRPPFAGTTHKAQGGTFSAVFIDRTNINKCFDPEVRARLMYVALTRARKEAYINA